MSRPPVCDFVWFEIITYLPELRTACDTLSERGNGLVAAMDKGTEVSGLITKDFETRVHDKLEQLEGSVLGFANELKALEDELLTRVKAYQK
jgi:hypothetical protein